MKYAHIDSNKKLLGFYSDDVHSTIPTPHVVVTDEQWQRSLDNNYNCINSDGSGSVVDFSTDAEKASMVRRIRDAKLVADVDAVAGNALRWAELTSEQKADWANYRQALLNVPQQAGFPDVAWPTEPDA